MSRRKSAGWSNPEVDIYPETGMTFREAMGKAVRILAQSAEDRAKREAAQRDRESAEKQAA